MLHLQHIKLNKNTDIKMGNIIVDKKNELIEGFVNSLYYQIKLTEKYAKMLAKQLEEMGIYCYTTIKEWVRYVPNMIV